jgi:predicted pyridoxine 5'-phosphate oxidase superfamily flavin-nucleotide-binding protein
VSSAPHTPAATREPPSSTQLRANGKEPSSAFHAGEAAVQTRVGVRERMEQIGHRAIRAYMPDEHRELFEKLPMLVVGSLDAGGRPWASLVVGRPGFIQSPDARALRVRSAPVADDPLYANLARGAPIALLGIELATRRRNRANGRVTAADGRGFDVRVEQSFGNCPQYINARKPMLVAVEHRGARKRAAEGSVLSPHAAELIARADTFFIATAGVNAPSGEARDGCDVSHRGGNPGFVRVAIEDGASVLYWPDFRGNFMFNTLGNLELNPRAGLLFMDFDVGEALLLTGRAEVIWDGALAAAFPGAERMLRFVPQRGVWVNSGVALRWSAREPARQLAATGP